MKLPTAQDALALAQAVICERYPDAAFAFAAGSILRGEGVYLSDIDLVVIYDELDCARRESFLAQGVPVEAFVHDPQTLAWFVEKDAEQGRPVLLNMIAEGVILGGAPMRGAALQSESEARLAKGPDPLSPAALNALRYEITDAIDDLNGGRGREEALAIGAGLYPKLVQLALRGRGRWNGSGKWAPRLLKAVDPALAATFDHAFRTLFASGDGEAVIALALQEMAPHGGRLFEGDRRAASPAMRAAGSQPRAVGLTNTD